MAVDYKSFKEKKDPKVKGEKEVYSKDASNKWWSSSDPLTSLRMQLGNLSNGVMTRMVRYRVATRLYGTSDLFGQYYKPGTNTNNALWVPDRLPHNVVQSNVDNLVS